ncbi:MAG: hypothetical protein AAGM38_15705, partial [Pseudomonadota bacterium]
MPRSQQQAAPRARRGSSGASSLAAALLALSVAAVGAPREAAAQGREPSGAPRCLLESERELGLKIGLLSLAPAGLCASNQQVIELRNDLDTPLSDARIYVTPPLGEGRMRFTPLGGAPEGARRFIEVSADGGATWTDVDPPLGSGAPGDPLIFSSAQIPALARLGPAGGGGDRVLVRWNAALGEAFGDSFGPEAALELSANARDLCGRAASAPLRLARLPLARPRLSARLEGRNASRGGGFAPTVAAAPGDEIEWRVVLQNTGEASAQVARALITAVGEPAALETRVLTLDGVASGGRRSTSFRERVGSSCAPRALVARPSWGCSAPEEGAAAALSELGAGVGSARLLLAPDANAVTLDIDMISADGAARPGDRAVVTARLRNEGPPAFAPRLLVTLPDGYGLDPDQPLGVFSTDAGVAAAVLATADPDAALARDGTYAFALQDAAGGEATLGDGGFVQLRLPVRRISATVLETDWLSARLAFESGCGEAFRSRAARIEVTPRQSSLSARLIPLDEPIVSGPGDVRRFRAIIANDGEEAAAGVAARLELGAAWVDAIPAPDLCRRDPAARRVFLCRAPDAARPGGAVSFEFDVTAGVAAGPPAPGSAAPEDAPTFAIRLSAQAFTGAAAADERPITAATAEGGAVGFRLTQALEREGGGGAWAPRGAAPIDLGERVAVTLTAEWWGAGRAEIAEASLFQTLPEALSLLGAEGALDGEPLTAALQPGRNQALWGLEAITGSGRFEGRVTAVAVDPDTAPQRPGAAPAAAAAVSIEAEAVFGLHGATYGLEGAAEGATRAAPLTRQFRKPDLTLAFEIAAADADDAQGADQAQGLGEARDPDQTSDPVEARRRDARAPIPARAGRTISGVLTLANGGGGPAFLDWARLGVPPSVSIEPLLSDGLDNDLDGRIDEPDEAETAVIERGDGIVWLRWLRAPQQSAGAVPADAARLEPGLRTGWPVALRIAPDAEPGARLELVFEAQYGARGFAEEETDRRSLAAGTRVLTLPDIGGALALSHVRRPEGAGRLGAPEVSREATHGAEVEHRLILRLPPGRHPEARIALELPRALSDAEPRSLRLGAALSCKGARGDAAIVTGDAASSGQSAGPGESAGAGDGAGRVAEAAPPLRLEWPLGDCVVDDGASDAARTVLLDVAGVIEDAPSAAPETARRAWRRPRLAAIFERAVAEADGAFLEGPAAPLARPLGVSAFRITGPLLETRLLSVSASASPNDGDAAARRSPAFDAGDRFSARFELVNRGDRPATALVAGLAPPPEAAGLDCAAAQARFEDGGRRRRRRASAAPRRLHHWAKRW